jgi:hypothetical protein
MEPGPLIPFHVCICGSGGCRPLVAIVIVPLLSAVSRAIALHLLQSPTRR